LRKRRDEAAGHAVELAKLEAAVKTAAADASQEACRYDLKRTEAAMDLAHSLPAGCDRILGGLRQQHAFISRRAADQQAFTTDMRQAAAHRRACDFALAAEDLSRGLSILEADPEARCGKLSETAAQAETDLQAVLADELWRTTFAEGLRAAKAEKAPPQRLERLYPIIARIGSLDAPSCFSAQRGQAEKLAQAAGEDLVLPDALAAKLTTDDGLSKTVDEVAAQRHKLLAQATALQTMEAAEQSPSGGKAPSLDGAATPGAHAAAPKGKHSAKTPAAAESAQ
jgi:hypothetical protein